VPDLSIVGALMSFRHRAASVKVGSLLPCGGAAPSYPPRKRSWLTAIGSIQPKTDIHARRSEGAAARAKDFPEADIPQCQICLGYAAPRSNVSEAQIATFAKSSDLAAWRALPAAGAKGKAALRRTCSREHL